MRGGRPSGRRFLWSEFIATFADNGEAKAGLARAIEAMVGHELDRRNAKAAAVLIAELPSPPPALEARLCTLEGDLAREKDELEKLRRIEREGDVGLGSRARAALALLVAVGFNAGAVVYSFVAEGRDGGVTPLGALGIAAAFLASVALAAWIARDVITQNEANRRLAWALGVAAMAMLAHRAVALQLGVPVSIMFAGDLVILATSGGTVAATLDRRFTPVSVFLALAPFLIALRPVWMPYTFPLVATLGAILLAMAWRQGASKTR
jgi:serine/threonine-protein kinase